MNIWAGETRKLSSNIIQKRAFNIIYKSSIVTNIDSHEHCSHPTTDFGSCTSKIENIMPKLPKYTLYEPR